MDGMPLAARTRITTTFNMAAARKKHGDITNCDRLEYSQNFITANGSIRRFKLAAVRTFHYRFLAIH